MSLVIRELLPFRDIGILSLYILQQHLQTLVVSVVLNVGVVHPLYQHSLLFLFLFLFGAYYFYLGGIFLKQNILVDLGVA